jgi:hypothetical protein
MLHSSQISKSNVFFLFIVIEKKIQLQPYITNKLNIDRYDNVKKRWILTNSNNIKYY